MKKNIVLLLSIFLLISFVSCDKSVTRQKIAVDKNIEALKFSKSLQAEYEDYLHHARTCKTQYAVNSYINKLPLMKKTQIESCGGADKWNKYLAWLRDNDAPITAFTSQGVPIYKRTTHYSDKPGNGSH